MGLVARAVIACPLQALAQQTRKVAKIGALWHAANEQEEAALILPLRKGFAD
jgi:hypothetical protein